MRALLERKPKKTLKKLIAIYLGAYDSLVFGQTSNEKLLASM